MKRKVKILSFFLAFMMLLSSTACSSTDDAYIYFELPETPSTLDPQVASTDSELLIIRNIFEGLLRKDEKGEIVPAAAENYKKDGLNYTFTLKDGLKWNNGEALTAYDFEFALKRALSSETKAPFAARLFCIKGAKEIYNGVADTSDLAVKAYNNSTLAISLSYDDPEFLDTLTTSIAMPCNASFFNSSDGKYGIFADTTLSCGSYEITRWRKETFGIRLYKNDEYHGDFTAKNAAVFLTCTEDDTLTKLEKNNIDMAFIDSTLTTVAKEKNLKTAGFQNICWVLTLGNRFSHDMRKAFSMLVGEEIYHDNLKDGFSVASSIYPSCIDGAPVDTVSTYDKDTAKQLYLKELEKLQDKKFPSNVVLYYFDDGNVKPVVTDIVGHWQSNLSAFVNIEAAKNSYTLSSELTSGTYDMAIFPIRADSGRADEYLKKFGINYNGENIKDIENSLLAQNSVVPIMHQETTIAYSPALQQINFDVGNGYIDFAYIVKEE